MVFDLLCKIRTCGMSYIPSNRFFGLVLCCKDIFIAVRYYLKIIKPGQLAETPDCTGGKSDQVNLGT